MGGREARAGGASSARSSGAEIRTKVPVERILVKGGKAAGATELANMYEQAVIGLKRRTKARVGDKTLMDALMPAAEAARAGADGGLDVVGVCNAAASAACSGAEATRDHRARFGRAKHQGDRTIGHRDPGAVSMCVILSAFASALEEIYNREQ